MVDVDADTDTDAELKYPGLPVEEIQWEPITELEIYRLVKTTKATTAPGEDRILILV